MTTVAIGWAERNVLEKSWAAANQIAVNSTEVHR
jgi:hypothetical protein